MKQNHEIFFSWSTPEFVHRAKKVDWYWGVGILAVALSLVAIFLVHNYILVFFIIVAAGLIMMRAQRKPTDHTIEIGDAGISIGNKFIEYDLFDAFWIKSGTETLPPELLLHSSSNTVGGIDPISIGTNVNIVDLRAVLSEVVPEIELKESWMQYLIRRYGI